MKIEDSQESYRSSKPVGERASVARGVRFPCPTDGLREGVETAPRADLINSHQPPHNSTTKRTSVGNGLSGQLALLGKRAPLPRGLRVLGKGAA